MSRDIRVAKRNIDSYERFLLLAKDQLENLTTVPSTDASFLLYEVLDLMKNHIDDDIAQQALLHMLTNHNLSFKVYIFVSPFNYLANSCSDSLDIPM